jgi:hypothetical protein
MASYKQAVQWLADNEDAAVSIEEFKDLVAVVLVADLWKKPNELVAKDVFKLRSKME